MRINVFFHGRQNQIRLQQLSRLQLKYNTLSCLMCSDVQPTLVRETIVIVSRSVQRFHGGTNACLILPRCVVASRRLVWGKEEPIPLVNKPGVRTPVEPCRAFKAMPAVHSSVFSEAKTTDDRLT